MSTSTTSASNGVQATQAGLAAKQNPDHDAHEPMLGALIASACALVVCVGGRIPHRLLDAAGVRGWVLELVVVVMVVTGARAIARAPFASAGRARSRAGGDYGVRATQADHGVRATQADHGVRATQAGSGLRAFAVTIVAGVALTLPIYALLRATPTWWLVAWALFAVVTIVGQVAMPLALRAQSGPLVPADPPLVERVRSVAERAGVDVGRGVLIAGGKPGNNKPRCNAYVVGLGATRRVVLERALAEWPPELVDQVVAHEIGHWRLRHITTRLPLTLAAQLVTFAFAAWVLSFSPLLHWAGVTGAGDPRSYPLLLLVTPLLALPARCLVAWRDRAQERAADRFALTLLAAPDHFAAMLERAAAEGGAPRRLPWWRRLIATHPPIDERAFECTRFASTA